LIILKKRVYIENEHEKNVVCFLMDFIGEDDIFFDVGANIGYYSMLVSEVTENVHAFEFNKLSCDVIKQNNILNKKNVVINNKAVWHSSGKLRVDKQEQINPKGNVLSEDRNVEDIESISLDDYGVMPTIIKIDVEGAEKFVLEGMEKILEQGVELLMEVHIQKYIQKFGYSFEDLLNILYKYNYICYEIVDFRNKNKQYNYVLEKIKNPEDYKSNIMIYARPYNINVDNTNKAV